MVNQDQQQDQQQVEDWLLRQIFVLLLQAHGAEEATAIYQARLKRLQETTQASDTPPATPERPRSSPPHSVGAFMGVQRVSLFPPPAPVSSGAAGSVSAQSMPAQFGSV